jgi:hypothetical protein
MKSKLLHSFIFVFGFWWAVLFLLFSLEPRLTTEALTRLGAAPDTSVSALNHIKYWAELVAIWTIPMAFWLAVSLGLGFAVTSVAVIHLVVGRKNRVKEGIGYRGIGLTMGEFPQPVMLKSVPMKGLSASGTFGQRLNEMTPEQLALLKEIFEVIAAYPEAFPGDGHGVTLLEHTINVVENILAKPDSMPLSAVAAAAHDMGKITAFKKDGDEWKRVKMHDKESGKWLALLPTWWKLPEDERNALVMAVKYDHSRGALPTRDDDGRAAAIAMQIIQQVSQADSQATKDEKQKVLDAREVDALILQSFIDELPRFTWQDMGIPPGVKAVGWKLGKRLYFLESQLRERCLAVLDPDLTAALGGFYREKGKIAPFSIALMKVLNDQGWLVKEIGKIKVPDDMPLWKIKAGSKEFSAIIAIDVPDDMLDRLPPKDTSYQLEVVGAHVVQSSSATVADLSLDGVLSTGRATRPKVEKVKAEKAKDVATENKPLSAPIEVLAPSNTVTADKPKAKNPVPVPEPAPHSATSTENKPEGTPALHSTFSEPAEPEVCLFDDLIPGLDEIQGKSPGGSASNEPILNGPSVAAAENRTTESPETSVVESVATEVPGNKVAPLETRPETEPRNIPSKPDGGSPLLDTPATAHPQPTTKTNWSAGALYKEKTEKPEKSPQLQADSAEKLMEPAPPQPKKPPKKDKQAKGGFMDGLW